MWDIKQILTSFTLAMDTKYHRLGDHLGNDSLYYIPHLSNPAIWLVEIAFINFNCSCKIPGNHA